MEQDEHYVRFEQHNESHSGVRFCIPKFGKKIRHAGAKSKTHTKIRRVCSEKAHFAENSFRMHFLVEER